jgi:hypothetical protein
VLYLLFQTLLFQTLRQVGILMLATIDAGGRKSTAWATSTGKKGHNLEELGAAIGTHLEAARVVLAVEAPLWIPLRGQQSTMTAARNGEGMSWAGRVGAGVLAAGLANLSVVLRTAKPSRVVFDETNAPGSLVVLEAYRPSAGAGHADVADAILAALVARWPNNFACPIERPADQPVLNLVAAVALALGIPVSPSDLGRETKVIDPSRLD